MRTITEKKELNAIRLFTVFYTLFFTVVALWYGDYKFLFYTVYMIVVTWGLSHYYQRLHFGVPLVFLISLFGLLHLLGSTVYIGGIRLYDVGFFGGYMHYDNLVHTFGGAIAAVIGHNMLQNHLDNTMKHHPLPFLFLLVTFASGLGAYNEIIEFGLVVFMGMGAQIGDYYNNALDLVCNFNGALAASVGIYLWNYHRSK